MIAPQERIPSKTLAPDKARRSSQKAQKWIVELERLSGRVGRRAEEY